MRLTSQVGPPPRWASAKAIRLSWRAPGAGACALDRARTGPVPAWLASKSSGRISRGPWLSRAGLSRLARSCPSDGACARPGRARRGSPREPGYAGSSRTTPGPSLSDSALGRCRGCGPGAAACVCRARLFARRIARSASGPASQGVSHTSSKCLAGGARACSRDSTPASWPDTPHRPAGPI